MNEVVKYRNEINQISLKGFTATEQDLLMAVCAKIKDCGDEEIVLGFTEIKALIKGRNLTDRELKASIDKTMKKLNQLSCKIDSPDGEETAVFSLFPTCISSLKKRTFTVAVNQVFVWMLNDLTREFTLFELREFVGLASKYTKSLYRYLKQFRSTGKFIIGIEDFRERMDVPVKYTNKYLMDDIVNPSVRELSKYFKNLSVEPIKGSGRGRPIQGLKFTFAKDKDSRVERIEEKGKSHSDVKVGSKKNSFTDFEQRQYDFEDLERKLLNK